MSLLQTPSSEISPEQYAQVAAARLKTQATEAYKTLVKAQNDGIQLFWGAKVSPQLVADALGKDAGKLFSFHSQVTNCLIGIAQADGIPPAVLPPSNAFTVNPDGTVTISDQPYTP